MKHAALVTLSALLLAACGGGTEAPVEAPDTAFEFEPEQNRGVAVPSADRVPTPAELADASADVDMDGRVTLSVTKLVEETDPNTCLVMMSVDNGMDETVTAGLFAFDLEGGGETAGANMFPQEVEPGARKTAQIILPGKSCDVAQTVTSGQPSCKLEDGSSCVDALSFKDSEVAFAIDG